MKVITLTEPWATLTMIRLKATGRIAKKFETRSWATKHRGELAIHAAKGFPAAARDLCDQEPFKTVLYQAGYASWRDLPTAAVLGTVVLVRCIPGEMATRSVYFQDHEAAFGFFDGGDRIAWHLADPQPFASPVEAKGKLSVWDIDLPAIRSAEEVRSIALAEIECERIGLKNQVAGLAHDAHRANDQETLWVANQCAKMLQPKQ